MTGHILFEMELHSWENNELYEISLQELADSWLFSRDDREAGRETIELPFSVLGARADVAEVLIEMKKSNSEIFVLEPYCTINVQEDIAYGLIQILNVFDYLESMSTPEEVDFELYRPYWKDYKTAVQALAGNDLYKVQVGDMYWVVVHSGDRSSVLPALETFNSLEKPLASWSIHEGPQSWQVSSSKIVKIKTESEVAYLAVDTQELKKFSLLPTYLGNSIFSDAEAIFDWLNDLEIRWARNGFFASSALVSAGIRRNFFELCMDSGTRMRFKGEWKVWSSYESESQVSVELEISHQGVEPNTFEILKDLLFFGREYLLETEAKIEFVSFLNFSYGSKVFEQINFERTVQGDWIADANEEIQVNGKSYFFPIIFQTLYSLWGQSHASLVSLKLKPDSDPNSLPRFLRLRRDNNPYHSSQFYVDGVKYLYPADLLRSRWA